MTTRASTRPERDAEPVPFFTGAHSFDAYWPTFQANLDEMLSNGKVSHGMLVERLEQAIAARTGARAAIAVNSGTDALVLMLRAAGIGSGDEVVVPCFSFIATASSVAIVGATPVFVDVDPSTYCVDVDQVHAAIGAHTKAVMPVHLFIQMADMDSLAAIATETGVAIIEDSAEAIDMWWGGTHAGLLGLGGVLSFFPTKTLGALGDAGMVLTDDLDMAEHVRLMRHHGRSGRTVGYLPGISHEAIEVGTNSKMDEIQAAFLLARLEHLSNEVRRRQALADAYAERLAPIAARVQCPSFVDTGKSNPVYYVYVIEADERDELGMWLDGCGIGTEVYYPRPLHLQPCFAELGHSRGDFPVAEALCDRTLALPFYPDLQQSQLDFVCRSILDFYEKRR